MTPASWAEIADRPSKVEWEEEVTWEMGMEIPSLRCRGQEAAACEIKQITCNQ